MNLIVRALAGTGKTTTIKAGVNALWYQPMKRGFVPTEEQQAIISHLKQNKWISRIHMTSFSTDAAEQLATGIPKEVTTSSTYGLGLQQAKLHGMAKSVDRGDWKYSRILDAKMKAYADEKWTGSRMDMLSVCAKARLELYRQMTSDQLESLADHYGVEIPWNKMDLFLEVVNHMLKVGLEQCDEFDYTDMVWIPVMKCILGKQFDMLFVDEFQDMGKAQQEICYRTARLICAIGDTNQAIYGFIGADAKATDSFKAALSKTLAGVDELPLTYTRRCPKSVVARVNHIVPELKALPEAPEGSVTLTDTYKVDPKGFQETDMVICPTNAPLVSLLFKLQKMGKKAFIRKSDIIDSMIRYAKSHDKGIEELRTSIQRMLDQVSEKKTKKARNQYDKYCCLAEIAAECHTVNDVIKTIHNMFPKDGTAGSMRMCTVHRSKGLEAPRVIFWEWDRCGQYAELPWEIQQARNLEYVGCTRAMKDLVLARS